MKKKILIAALCSGVALAGAFALSITQNVKAEEITSSVVTNYEYRLLGETYTVQGGLISATDPQGNAIPNDVKSVYLNWASGSYTFVYSKKIVKVKVYEEMPTDNVVYSFDVPTEAISGVELDFPKANISSNIIRVDGAPVLEEYNYQVSVYSGTDLVQTFDPNKDELSYVFSKSGEYTLSYEYTNCFARLVSFDWTVSVRDERIIKSNIQENVGLYSKISTNDFYGDYLGVNYPVSVTVVDENGNQTPITTEYTFTAAGKYVLELSCAFDGNAQSKTLEITVAPDLTSFIAETDSITDISVTNKLSNMAMAEKNLLVLSVNNNASFYYNGVVNLNNFTKNDQIISLFPNALKDHTGVSAITVSLIDVYDSKNVVKINYERNSNRDGAVADYDNVFVSVAYGSVSSAVKNYSGINNKSVAWSSTFYNYWASPEFSQKNAANTNQFYSLNFSYDIDENTIYSYSNYGFIGVEGENRTGAGLYPILNMNSNSLSEKFQGFKTGEVYLKVEITGSGDVAISSIAGKTIANVDKKAYEANDGILTGENDFSITGVVGVTYPLKAAVSGKFVSETAVCVLRDPDGNIVERTNEGFVPQKAGTYSLTYTAKNEFGVEVEKKFALEVKENQDPIMILYTFPSQIDAGSLYTVRKPVVTGGHGEVSYQIYLNGNKVAVGDKVKVETGVDITIDAVDALGLTCSKTFTANINKDVIESDIQFPRSAVCGEKFIFPQGKIYYYNTQSYVDYEIYVDGEKMGSSIVLPDAPTTLFVEYRTATQSQTFALNVIPKTYATPSDLLDFEGEGEITSAGFYLDVKKDSEVQFPYPMSSSELEIIFYVLKAEMNFGEMHFSLTGLDGKNVRFTIADLDTVKPKLLINGVDTGKIVPRMMSIGTNTMPESFKGQEYYSFTIAYNNAYQGILVSGKPLARITTDSNGFAFDGFNGGVYLDICAGDVAVGADSVRYCLNTVSNQKLITIAFENGDVVGPQLYSDGLAKNKIVAYGEIIDFSSLMAYDVLSANSTLRITLITPDNITLFENQLAKDVGKVCFKQYGNYRLTVVAVDGNGQRTRSVFTYTVEDVEAPILTLEKTENIKAAQNTTVTLYGATAKDNYSACTIRVVVYAPNGEVFTLENKAEIKDVQLQLTMVGEYKIRYFAIDENENISSAYYTIEVE